MTMVLTACANKEPMTMVLTACAKNKLKRPLSFITAKGGSDNEQITRVFDDGLGRI